jgi:hypothetical protein
MINGSVWLSTQRKVGITSGLPTILNLMAISPFLDTNLAFVAESFSMSELA